MFQKQKENIICSGNEKIINMYSVYNVSNVMYNTNQFM